MAASTITRDTWTNDTGSAASPVGDGTIIQNSVLQNHVYARIDAMLAGAGAYATLTLGGLLAAEGFGSHSFSAGGTGQQAIIVRNTSAGTGNYAAVVLGNNAVANAGTLHAFSSTYTTSNQYVQDSLLLEGIRVGGVGISAINGPIRWWVGNTERARVTSTGQLLIGDTTNADVTSGGLTILNSDASHAIALKGSDVAHGLGASETDTFGFLRQYQAGSGGLEVYGLSESTSKTSLVLTGNLATAGDTTKSTAAQAAVMVRGTESGAGAMSANANIFAIHDGIAGNTRFIFDAEGDMHYDGAAPANYDRWDDVALLRTLDRTFAGPDLVETQWDHYVTYNRADLERAGIVSPGGFVNLTKHTRLLNGAMWQLFTQHRTLEQRVRALEGRAAS
jgi:hypothetical protein